MDELISRIKNIIHEELAGYRDESIWVVVEIIGKGTGVKGDKGLYGHIIVISIISEKENKFVEFSWTILKKIQSRIIGGESDVSRVLYNLTGILRNN